MRHALETLLHRRLIEEQLPTPRFVLFVDMLGFSDLTERYPNPIVWDFTSDEFTAATTDSAKQLGRFQYVLNSIAEWTSVGHRPSHVMLFSDCAFLVYETLVQAAESSAELMRRLLRASVPARMGLAHGTWHPRRFSFDFEDIAVTRAVFYGTAVVRAAVSEKHGGKGCRIFVHGSINSASLQALTSISSLDVHGGHSDVPHELNYLYPAPLDTLGNDNDWKLHTGLALLRASLSKPIPPDVDRHYVDTVDALNRMRAQLNRPALAPLP